MNERAKARWKAEQDATPPDGLGEAEREAIMQAVVTWWKSPAGDPRTADVVTTTVERIIAARLGDVARLVADAEQREREGDEQPELRWAAPSHGFGSALLYGACNAYVLDPGFGDRVCGFPRRADGSCGNGHPPQPKTCPVCENTPGGDLSDLCAEHKAEFLEWREARRP